MMKGLVVGTEAWTTGEEQLEVRTRLEFVRPVDWLPATGAVETQGAGSSFFPILSPFPVALQALAVVRWESLGRPPRLRTARGSWLTITPCVAERPENDAIPGSCYVRMGG